MLCLQGSPLYQWDTNRQLKIESVDIGSKFEVHCCMQGDANSLVVEPKIEGDVILVNIPNILLQRYGILRAFVVIEGDTVYDTSLYVIARPKPDDYIYTETEIYTVEKAVETALHEAKESGEFNGKDGADGKDGYTPQKGIDYYTDGEKAELVDTVIEESVGDINTALQEIIALQEELLIPDASEVAY